MVMAKSFKCVMCFPHISSTIVLPGRKETIMSDLMRNTFNRIKKLFQEGEDQSGAHTRIESAKITSNRLQALQRMRENSPTTPDYKLGGEEVQGPAPTSGARGRQRTNNVDDIDLDFGMKIGT